MERTLGKIVRKMEKEVQQLTEDKKELQAAQEKAKVCRRNVQLVVSSSDFVFAVLLSKWSLMLTRFSTFTLIFSCFRRTWLHCKANWSVGSKKTAMPWLWLTSRLERLRKKGKTEGLKYPGSQSPLLFIGFFPFCGCSQT